MWYKNVGTRFFRFVTNHVFDRPTDGRTDRQTESFLIDRVACNAYSAEKNRLYKSPLKRIRKIYSIIANSATDCWICSNWYVPAGHKENLLLVKSKMADGPNEGPYFQSLNHSKL